MNDFTTIGLREGFEMWKENWGFLFESTEQISSPGRYWKGHWYKNRQYIVPNNKATMLLTRSHLLTHFTSLGCDKEQAELLYKLKPTKEQVEALANIVKDEACLVAISNFDGNYKTWKFRWGEVTDPVYKLPYYLRTKMINRLKELI